MLPAAERKVDSMQKQLHGNDVIYNLAVLLDTVGKKMPTMAYDEIAALLAMPDVTRGGVLATAQSYLKCLRSPGVRRSLNSTSFSLADFITGKPMTIYLVLPVERITSHRVLLRLWLGTMLRAVASRTYQAETPTLFMCDECGQLGGFPYLETFITLCRTYSCRVMAFFQDLAQLEAAYPTNARTLLNNCGLLAFGFSNRRLAEQWSTFFETSPSALRKMSTDELIMLLPNGQEYCARRLDYLRDLEFAGQFDRNSLYSPPPACSQQRSA